MKGAEGMREIARALSAHLGAGIGFCLVVFEQGKPTVANYISNCDRSDMITAMRETASRLERNQTMPTPEEN